MSAPFKMKGHSLPGPNQRVSPVKQKIDYKAQGDVIDKRNKAIKNFDKDAADFGGYIPDAKQSKAIEERKISLKDKLTSSTDSIRNVNTQETNRLKNQAFDKLMGNNLAKGVPYASPAKQKEGEKVEEKEKEKKVEEKVSVVISEDGSKMTRTKGNKSASFKKNPAFDPKKGDTATEEWLKA